MDTVKIQVKDETQGARNTFEIYRPTKCPRCKHAIGSDVLHVHLYALEDGRHRLAIIFQCNNCFEPFICLYTREPGYGRYELDEAGPVGIQAHTFQDEIQALSPRFAATYNQAYEAEQRGLTEVCGMAYGKALEVLLKDFLITSYPGDETKIVNMPLGNCIKSYITDERIKVTAERCAWLRNDQTHYVAKHEDLDLEDLKKLLNAVLYWISIALLTESASEIQPIHPA